ncbi:MAG: glutamate racemase [Candidatus Thiodiazotropha sp. (ex Epidulcina cf. delphinae)]|nr:glutamate racemase [Candidatus Thiodiazotropha sp. (ex Epidulcina cf. delphinae)]
MRSSVLRHKYTSRPIGIFDSGIGGLSVVRHIRRILPSEDLLYVSDRAHLPYGTKDSQYILDRTHRIAEFLIQRGVKAIVIACNTATAVAVHHLRKAFQLPIIGMEPGVKPAILQSRNGLIGVLATEGTLGSGKFQTLLNQHADGSEIIICPCHGWVEAIERDGMAYRKTLELVRRQLTPVLEQGVDTLVLGCTHFPYLEENILKVAGPSIAIIDTGPAVAKQLRRRLVDENLLSTDDAPGSERFWCSAPPEQTRKLIEKLQGQPCVVNSLPTHGKSV